MLAINASDWPVVTQCPIVGTDWLGSKGVCRCVWVCLCVYVCVCVHMCVLIRVCTMSVCMCGGLLLYSGVCRCVRVCVGVCGCV